MGDTISFLNRAAGLEKRERESLLGKKWEKGEALRGRKGMRG